MPILHDEAVQNLLQLDSDMRKHYADSLKFYTQQLSPVIHAQFDEEGGTYILRRNGQTTVGKPVPELYKILKSVSHTALGIYTTIAPALRGHGDWHEGLKEFHQHLVASLASIEAADLPPEPKKNCIGILSEGIAFTGNVMHKNSVTLEEFGVYARAVAPMIEPNVRLAAKLQVDAFEELVEEWRKMMGEEEWNRLYVCVTTAWAMRRENVHFQIFEHMMGKEQVNQRLIIAEGFNDTEAAFELLGRIVLDRSASELIFQDAARLDVELMGEGALDEIEARACPIYPSIRGPKKPYYSTEMP